MATISGGAGITTPSGVTFVPGTIVPENGAVVTDGQAKTLTGPDGSIQFGTVTMGVSSGTVTAKLPAGKTVITDQAGAVPVQDADGTSINCTAVIAANDALSYVGIPGTAALVTNGLSVNVANFNGSGPLAGTASITGGFLTSVNLQSQTNTLVSNGFTTDLGTVGVSGAGSDFATVNVASGGITSVGVSFVGTKALVTNGQALTVPVTGTYTTTATLTVSNGAVTGIALS